MLSRIEIAASPFDAGLQLGRFGAAATHAHLVQSPAWRKLMTWRGSEAVRTMQKLARDHFPGIWQELEGLASGLALPFEDTFIWNCRGDLWAMAPEGCTTVALPDPGRRRIVHNEDGNPALRGHCAIGSFRIGDGPGFASFVYPASLPGHTFAVTNGGLAITVNNIRFLHVEPGVPRMILARALLDHASIDTATDLLARTPRAGGFHLTLADRHAERIASVEFGHHACSVETLKLPSVHANHAIHSATRDLPQIITGSSGFRQCRGNLLIATADAESGPIDPIAIATDQHNARFPIWRNDPSDDDNENTLACADIMIRTNCIRWRVRDCIDGADAIELEDGRFVRSD